jgi:3-hydroxyisobutyrate dehydrogenase-like beta-hydroxyacid dehydrogenase
MATDPSTAPRVGVVGLGKMGSALADALLAGGFPIGVWNRTAAKAAPALKAGAKLAPSVAALARQSDVLVSCLTDYAALEASLTSEEVGGALRGKIIVDVTSIRLEELAGFLAWTEAHGVSLLKGTVPGYPDDVRRGLCSILYGGPASAFDAALPILRAMGGAPSHVGESHAAGVEMGRAFYCFLFPTLIAFLYGAAFCKQAGLSVETYARDLVLPTLKAVPSGMAERLARAFLARRYDEDVQSTLNIWREAFDNVEHSAAAHGLDPAFLAAGRALMDRAAAQGFGQHDLAAVFEALIDRKA